MGTKPDDKRVTDLIARFATTAVLIQGELERMFPCGSTVEVIMSSRQKKPTKATIANCPFAHRHDGMIQVQLNTGNKLLCRVHYKRMELVA